MRTSIALITAIALVPATASAAGTKGWHGKTSQGQGMEFFLTKSKRLVEHAQTHYRLACSDGSKVTGGFGIGQKFGDTVAVSKTGRYGVSGTFKSGVPGKGNGTASYTFKGTVKPAKVTGSFSVSFKLDNGMTCTTGKVTYTLR
jgi:hypothetical protein